MRPLHLLLTAGAMLALAVPVAAQRAPTATAQTDTAKATVIQLNEQNNSNESGTATLTPVENGLQVVLDIKNAPSDAQPAHIHDGTCANLGKVVYPLKNVVDGKSTTVVNGVSLPKLESGTYAINVHKSTSDLKTYVACGDIKAASSK